MRFPHYSQRRNRDGRLAAGQNFLSERLPNLLMYFTSGERRETLQAFRLSSSPISSDYVGEAGPISACLPAHGRCPCPTASVGDSGSSYRMTTMPG